jgi:signal transduction protein with GAF and PtsI domain
MTMKKILLTVALASSLLAGCNKKVEHKANEKTEQSADLANPEMVIEEHTMEIPNKSDIAFEEALNKFDTKDYKASSEKIKEAIGFLKTEADSLKGTNHEHFEKSIEALSKLDKMLLEKPSSESEKSLVTAFENAETNLAHDYFYIADYYIMDQPATSKAFLKNGIKHLDNQKKRAKKN